MLKYAELIEMWKRSEADVGAIGVAFAPLARASRAIQWDEPTQFATADASRVDEDYLLLTKRTIRT